MRTTGEVVRRAVGLVGALLFVAVPAAAQQPGHAQEGAVGLTIPAGLRAEHQEIHASLERATRAPGQVGVAARELAGVLHPHFVREEQIALPPLGLLAPLARGEATEEMRAVLPMTDSLRAELPQMLREHVAIHAATERLAQAARAAGNASVAQLAEELMRHAESEEQIFYPAAVLVGDVVRTRLGAPAR